MQIRKLALGLWVISLHRYKEENELLPKNQHGFISQRSTMSAWADMLEEWAQNTEENEMTGVLLWDLSAAFDTLMMDQNYGTSHQTK